MHNPTIDPPFDKAAHLLHLCNWKQTGPQTYEYPLILDKDTLPLHMLEIKPIKKGWYVHEVRVGSPQSYTRWCLDSLGGIRCRGLHQPPLRFNNIHLALNAASRYYKRQYQEWKQ